MPKNELKLPESYLISAQITSPEDSYKKYTDAYTKALEAKKDYGVADSIYFNGDIVKEIDTLKRVPRTMGGLLGKLAYRGLDQQLSELYTLHRIEDGERTAAQNAYGQALGEERIAEEAGEIHFTENADAYYEEAQASRQG